ncbi:class I SAM-dependent methyltransferase [Reyranella sp.]|uniref:class I SAM-dependent methyltransferase n=1 Tax=Reyranella sp. TaxID=1929291 RepID=UPI003BAB23D2
MTTIAAFAGVSPDVPSVRSTPAYADALAYFKDYPARSLMSDHSRTLLYSLVRMMRPRLVAEIGTLHAGTTEVFARALWENGEGVVHTADPYGGDRCPPIIGQWPAELQHHVQFHAKSSMDFFSRMVLEDKSFGLILVDGNHDFEYAFFDLQMSARLIESGGIVVMDNAEQAGPFKAARVFLAANPAWREIGGALAAYDPSRPFNRERASLPETSFLILQAPDHLSIGAEAQSWGQAWTTLPQVRGLRFEVVAPCKGILHYQVHLRGFANGNRWVKEERIEGSVRIDAGDDVMKLDHPFERSLSVVAPSEFDDALFTLEFDLCWQGDSNSGPLALAALPTPFQ